MLSSKSFYADNDKLTVVVNHDHKVLLDVRVANLKEMCGLEKTQTEFKVLKDIINTIYKSVNISVIMFGIKYSLNRLHLLILRVEI